MQAEHSPTLLPSIFIILALIPVTVAFFGTSLSTALLAPILEFAPTVIGPSIFAPLPTKTFDSRVGCLFAPF